MDWFWYIARDNELFIDLDAGKADLKRLAKARARVRGAKAAKRLPIDSYQFFRSAKAYHFHLMIRLTEPLSPTARLVWEARFCDDHFRNQMNGGRLLLYGRTYSLLIAPRERVTYYRRPDFVCHCPGKHKDEVIAECPVAALLGSEFRLDAGFFGEPVVMTDALRCDVEYRD